MYCTSSSTSNRWCQPNVKGAVAQGGGRWRRAALLLVAGLWAGACVSVGGGEGAASLRAPGHLPVDLAPIPAQGPSFQPLREGDVVAHARLTARHGRVLQGAIEGRHRLVPVGTALALVIIRGDPVDVDPPADPVRRLWCDVRPPGRFSSGALDCFADLDGDDALDHAFTGRPRDGAAPFTMGLVTGATPLTTPTPMRPARAEERPYAWAGYRLCDEGTRTSPPRFTPVLSADGAAWTSGAQEVCGYGVWADARGAADAADGVQRLAIAAQVLEAAWRAGRWAVRDSARPAAATPAFVFQANHPVRPIADLYAEIEADLLEMLTPAVIPVAPARATRVTELHVGDVLITAPARHALTGVLQNDVRPRRLFRGFGEARLRPGRLVYGVPVAGGAITARSLTNRAIMWCAPERQGDGAAAQWRAVCLPEVERDTRWWPVREGLYAQPGPGMRSAYSADAPSVARAPVDFGAQLSLEAVFAGWEAGEVLVQLQVRADGDVYRLRIQRTALSVDGVARAAALGANVVLAPQGAGAQLISARDAPALRPGP